MKALFYRRGAYEDNSRTVKITFSGTLSYVSLAAKAPDGESIAIEQDTAGTVTYTMLKGSVISCSASARYTFYTSYIKLNGTTVASGSGSGGASYDYTVTTDVEITAKGASNGSTITITETAEED